MLTIMQRVFGPLALGASLAAGEWCGGKPGAGDGGPCRVEGPKSPADQPQWLAALAADRASTNNQTGFAGGVFDVPELRWTQSAYVAPQMHIYDRFFYDAAAGNYTVERWLTDVRDRYGGVDAIIAWPTYPNLGIDDRNQWDWFRALPAGGLAGVARFTAELKAHGVHVLWPYLFWDTGTRREVDNATGRTVPDEQVAVGLLKQTGGAGLNGDSLPFVPESFWEASLQQDYPLALQVRCAADAQHE
jgi:hypothetical protein